MHYGAKNSHINKLPLFWRNKRTRDNFQSGVNLRNKQLRSRYKHKGSTQNTQHTRFCSVFLLLLGWFLFGGWRLGRWTNNLQNRVWCRIGATTQPNNCSEKEKYKPNKITDWNEHNNINRTTRIQTSWYATTTDNQQDSSRHTNSKPNYGRTTHLEPKSESQPPSRQAKEPKRVKTNTTTPSRITEHTNNNTHLGVVVAFVHLLALSLLSLILILILTLFCLCLFSFAFAFASAVRFRCCCCCFAFGWCFALWCAAFCVCFALWCCGLRDRLLNVCFKLWGFFFLFHFLFVCLFCRRAWGRASNSCACSFSFLWCFCLYLFLLLVCVCAVCFCFLRCAWDRLFLFCFFTLFLVFSFRKLALAAFLWRLFLCLWLFLLLFLFVFLLCLLFCLFLFLFWWVFCVLRAVACLCMCSSAWNRNMFVLLYATSFCVICFVLSVLLLRCKCPTRFSALVRHCVGMLSVISIFSSVVLSSHCSITSALLLVLLWHATVCLCCPRSRIVRVVFAEKI